MISGFKVAVLILVLLFAGIAFATGPDQFEFRSSVAFDKAIDMALVDGRIFLLSPGTLSVLDASKLTPTLERFQSVTVDKDLIHAAAFGDIVVLASSRSMVEVYQSTEIGLIHRSSYSTPDSIVNLTVVDSRLYLAQGYGGVKVIDLSDASQIRVLQTLSEPDYALDVAVAGDFLFVLDALNGVTIFLNSDGIFEFFDEIVSEIQPADICAFKNGVAIAFGSQRCEVWHCNKAIGTRLEQVMEADFDITQIAGKRESDDILYLASETGDLASVGGVNTRTSYPRSIDDILAVENSSLYSLVALDQIGNVTAFKTDQNLESRAFYQSEVAPSAIVAASDALLLSTSAGIQELSAHGAILSPRMAIPGAAITQILVEFDPLLFTGAPDDGTVTVYQKVRGRWQFLTELASGLALKEIFAFGSYPDDVSLVVVGEDGICRYNLERDGSFSQGTSIVVDGTVSGADLSGNRLATISQHGEITVFSLESGQVTPAGTIQCKARPRDVEITSEGHIAVSLASGIQIFEFDQLSGEFSEHWAPAAIATAFDLFYEESSRELLIATGSTPVKYLDFSNPASIGTVYLIPGTDGTGKITYRENKLYCLSADWIRMYERIDQPSVLMHQSTLQSVNAAPNPFNSDTQITIELNPNAKLPLALDISIVNILGQTLYRNELLTTSTNVAFPLPQVIGESPAIASGVYFFVVRAAGEIVTRKLVLLK